MASWSLQGKILWLSFLQTLRKIRWLKSWHCSLGTDEGTALRTSFGGLQRLETWHLRLGGWKPLLLGFDTRMSSHSFARICISGPEETIKKNMLPGCVWRARRYLSLCPSADGFLIVQYKCSNKRRERPPCCEKDFRSDWPKPVYLQLTDHHW